MFDFETKLRHWRSLRPTRRGAAGKRSKRQRTTAFEFLEERCCPSTLDLWTGGGGTNLYSNAANWSLGVVPNNTAQTTYDVEIPAASAVTMDINPTIDNLTLDAASSSFSIEAARSFSLTGDVNNQGTINVGDTTGAAALEPNPTASGGTITLSGGGIINLNSGSIIYGYNNPILDNVDNTIQGQGIIESLDSFQNEATVDANVSGETLEIAGVTTTNTRTLEATAGGWDAGDQRFKRHQRLIPAPIPAPSPRTPRQPSLSISSTITGGNLTSVGGSVIHGTGGDYSQWRHAHDRVNLLCRSRAKLPSSPVI